MSADHNTPKPPSRRRKLSLSPEEVELIVERRRVEAIHNTGFNEALQQAITLVRNWPDESTILAELPVELEKRLRP